MLVLLQSVIQLVVFHVLFYFFSPSCCLLLRNVCLFVCFAYPLCVSMNTECLESGEEMVKSKSSRGNVTRGRSLELIV